MGISLLSSGKELSIDITKTDLLRQKALLRKQLRTLSSQIVGTSRDLRGLERKLRVTR